MRHDDLYLWYLADAAKPSDIANLSERIDGALLLERRKFDPKRYQPEATRRKKPSPFKNE
ncbi:MAG: hypothetical protein ACRYF5_00295 [Janthinobacterium lividum]